MRFRLRAAGVLLFLLAGTIMAQNPGSPRLPVRATLNFDAIPRPPVPADPLELVTGAAQPVQDAEQRIAAVTLLNKARDLSNVRAHPYHLKTSFISTGGLSTDGNWVLDDMSAGHAYRWTAQGPNYSAVNLYPHATTNGLYGSMTGGDIPLRLAQVRAAIFFTYPNVGPQASVRTASGFLNGVEQRCLLIATGAGNRGFAGGRNWEESEYCVNAKTGLLTTYSVAPGMFVRYDYSSGIQFHEQTIPTGFTITEAGRAVIEARTVSVTDPPGAKDPLFNPANLPALGVGRVMNPPSKLRMTSPVPGQPMPVANAGIQVVVLHGSAGPNGHVSDIEVLASSDSRLNQAALERASTITRIRPDQPGATQQSQELFLTMEFVTPAR